jgi:hypothetical protein
MSARHRDRQAAGRVWDNLPVRLRAELRAFTAAQAWLRVYQLPS